MLAAIVLGFLSALLGGARCAQLGATLVPNEVFYRQLGPDAPLSVFAPGVELAGGSTLLRCNSTASSAVACATACMDSDSCDVWGFTEGAVSSSQNGSCPCRLYKMDCGIVAPAASELPSGADASAVTSGFPVREQLNNLPGFTAQAGQGVPGADLPCNQTIIPGKCAVRSVYDAIILCVRTPECQAVVHYLNGTDGCSEPVSLLVHDGLAQDGSFMSPKVATMSRLDFNQLRDTTLLAADGFVIVPPDNETAAEVVPTDGTWLGCIVANHSLLAGTPVAVLDGVPTAEDCCWRCRQNGTACTLWQWCAQPGGCSFAYGPSLLELEHQQCKLLYNEAVALPMGFPPTAIEKGPDVPFVGGAPLALSGPPLPGYERLPGRNQFAFDGGSFVCDFTINPESQECVVAGPAQDVAAACNRTQECAGFILQRSAEPGTVEGILKTVLAADAVGLSPTNTLYLRDGVPLGQTTAEASANGGSGSGGSSNGDSSSSSSSLSAGAIAGIAVGAAAALAAGAGGAWALARRRRHALQTKQTNGSLKSASESGLDHGLGAADTPHTDSAPPTGGTAVSGISHSSGAASASAAAVVRSVGHPASGQLGGGPLTPTAMASPFAKGPPPGGSGSSAASPFSQGPLHSGGSQVSALHLPTPAQSAPVSGGSDGGAAVQPSAGSAPAAAGGPAIQAITIRRSTAASPFASAAARARSGFLPTPTYRLGEGQGSAGLGSAPLAAQGSGRSAALAAGPSGMGTALSEATCSTDAGSDSHMMLPELAAHVAQWNAQGSSDQSALVGGELHAEQSLLAPGALPASLMQWLVDVSEIEYLRWPNGELQELGRGASGVVYKARLRGETVAAKEVELGRSLGVQSMFVKEAERLHQLRHANIIALYGVCLAGPTGILLMEYAAGRDLHSALRIIKNDSSDRLFGWYGRGRSVAYDLAKALNYLSHKGVVHLDIKSSNVLLTGTGTAKLADVGTAHIQRGTYLSDLTGGAVGTLAWMSPEVMMGQKCTKAADIFSFGVCLWEIVTGEAPKRGAMRAPRVPEECPLEVSDMIERCMTLEPTERPTAQQLMQELEVLSERGRHRPGRARASLDRDAAAQRAKQDPAPASA